MFKLFNNQSKIKQVNECPVLQQGGALSLIECTLIEELDASDEDCE